MTDNGMFGNSLWSTDFPWGTLSADHQDDRRELAAMEHTGFTDSELEANGLGMHPSAAEIQDGASDA